MCSAVSAVSACPIGCAFSNSGFNNDATLSVSNNNLPIDCETFSIASAAEIREDGATGMSTRAYQGNGPIELSV